MISPTKSFGKWFQFDLVIYLIIKIQVIRASRKRFLEFWQTLLILFSSGKNKCWPSILICFLKLNCSFLEIVAGSVFAEKVRCSNSLVSTISTQEFLYVTKISFWIFSSRTQRIPSLSLSRVCSTQNPLDSWKDWTWLTNPSELWIFELSAICIAIMFRS